MKERAHIAINAHLLSREAGYRSAGIHGYILNTLKHLRSEINNLRLSIFTGPGITLPYKTEDLIHSKIDTQSPLKRIFWEQCSAPLALSKMKPDIFHGMAFSLPLLNRIPSITTIYDLSFLVFPERLSTARRTYLTQVTQFAAQEAYKILTISDASKSEIVNHYQIAPEKIIVAYPGVNEALNPLPEEDIQDFRRIKGLPSRFILYLGTIEPRKNLGTLLKAYAQSAFRDDVKLILAGGEGWMVKEVFALIDQLNLTNDVLLPGYIPDGELALWYNAAEIFVYPSIYEGFGIPVIEAMACGTPVITSNSTSLPEAAGQAGVIIEPDNVTSWTSSMEMLLADASEQNHLIAKGYEQAAKFSWKRTAAITVECYRQLLEEGN